MPVLSGENKKGEENMTAIIIIYQCILIGLSITAVCWAFHELAEERAAWKEDEAMMAEWLKNRTESLRETEQKLVDSFNAHNEWVILAKGNAKRYKKQIAALKGQVTKLRKQLQAWKGGSK